ncbi:UBA2 Ubiquitin-activating enzyme E1-like [Candida maltosa Xu316]
MAKDTYLKKVLGDECFDKIRTAKVVMIGAGGIGCELLKDLVLTGYGEIHVVDLDTITLSNLNRQFLFRQKDIDKSKSLTVSKAVQSFNYLGAKLVPHHGNVMDTKQFPIEWWNQFSFIFNALDNLEARSYVNRIALFTKKPLMESGTTGYAGQIQPIYPYYSECYDCHPKEIPKTFPVCTIRSTPSKPVHCITWAKEFLFHQLFDELETSTLNDADKIQSETDNQDEINNLNEEANELADIRNKILGTETSIFKVDIERLLKIDKLWEHREKPTPLNVSQYEPEMNELLSDNANESIVNADTREWSILENIYVLYKSCEALQRRLKSGKESFVAFDKDDEDTLNFVTSSSNLRSAVFNIPVQSKFDLKQIAGNIIPAIATTNAIIAGFSSFAGAEYYKHHQNLESTDFSDIINKTSSVFVSIRPNKYVSGIKLSPPADNCAVDSLTSRGVFTASTSDLNTTTLEDFIDKLVAKYGHTKDDISIQIGSRLIYDIDFDQNLDVLLGKIPGIDNGKIIFIQDDDDALENLELYVNIIDSNDSKFELPDIKLRPKKNPVEENIEPESNGISIKETEDGVLLLDDDGSSDSDLEIIEEDADEPPLKKQKM